MINTVSLVSIHHLIYKIKKYKIKEKALSPCGENARIYPCNKCLM